MNSITTKSLLILWMLETFLSKGTLRKKISCSIKISAMSPLSGIWPRCATISSSIIRAGALPTRRANPAIGLSKANLGKKAGFLKANSDIS